MRPFGFTFIELLISLSIISVISLLAVPHVTNMVYEQKMKRFFDVFAADVLFVQNQNMISGNSYRLLLTKDDYFIFNNKDGQTMVRRDYPNNLTLQYKSNFVVSFYLNGTVESVDTIYLSNEKSRYKIVFPLGKGRHYVEKQ